MTIRNKLALALSAIVLLLVLPLLLSYTAMQEIRGSTIALRDREFAASLLLGRIRRGLEELRDAETALIFLHDVSSRDRMSGALTRVAAMADSLDAFALESAATEIRGAIREVAALAPAEYQAALGGDVNRAERISVTRVTPAIARVDRAVSTAERSLRERTGARVVEASEQISRAGRAALLATMVALALALGIAIWLLRAISRPVRELERGMGQIADGEFDHRLAISPSRGDEFGRLAASFQTMARQLAELDKLKAEFVSVASHELKTPINVIVGYLQLLDDGAYGPLNDKQREILRTVEAQAGSLARLTKQLLDVSRFEAGGGAISPRPIEIRAFLVGLESAFRVLAQQRGVDLQVTWAEDTPHEVAWDADRMSEVLGNLLSNAIKFTAPGGSVALRAEPAGAGHLSLEVRDSGVGIPAEQLPHIFEKFYQADNQSQASTPGTGLGLAIAKEIVEAHKGTLGVDSTPGVGTTFALVIPLQATGRRAAPTQAALPAGAGAR
jgi:signal transduction histidine kinase